MPQFNRAGQRYSGQAPVYSIKGFDIPSPALWTVYLIAETNDEPDRWLRRNFVAMFEHELDAWYTNRVFCPKDRSFKAFKKIFKVRFCSMVLDLGKGSIEKA
jgi:hypothetical protein